MKPVSNIPNLGDSEGFDLAGVTDMRASAQVNQRATPEITSRIRNLKKKLLDEIICLTQQGAMLFQNSIIHSNNT